jgi:hypothetical protein
MDGRMKDERMEGSKDRLHKWNCGTNKHKLEKGKNERKKDKWMDVMDRWIDGMDGWMDGWDRWNGWMDGQQIGLLIRFYSGK